MLKQSTPGDDRIDLTDVIGRRSDILDNLRDAAEEISGTEDVIAILDGGMDEETADELRTIVSGALLDEARLDTDDLDYLVTVYELESEFNGSTLEDVAHEEPYMIADSDFEAYAEELADDLGYIDASAGWPNNHIDWKAAADDLRMDYTEVSFGGTAYQIRTY